MSSLYSQQLERLLRRYSRFKLAIYWMLWGMSLIVLITLIHLAPKQAIWLMRLADPISSAVNDYFWSLMPAGTWLVRRAIQITTWTLTHVVSWFVSDQVMAAVRLVVLDGIVVVTVSSGVSSWLVNRVARKLVVRFFLFRSFRKPEMPEVPIQPEQRLYDGRLEPKVPSLPPAPMLPEPDDSNVIELGHVRPPAQKRW